MLRSSLLQSWTAVWLMAQTRTAFSSTNTTNSFAPACVKLPQDADWPSAQVWAELNQTVGGRLIATVPAAHVCHDPTYDEAVCSRLRDDWQTVDPHVHDPVGILASYFQGQDCQPFTERAKPCTLGNYPVYSINVSGVSDIQAGLAFARRHDIRLTIKNTGHDLLGKSTGRGSLSLWMHNLKDLAFIDNYAGDSPYTGSAVRIGAGIMAEEIIPAAARRGKRVVTGSCSTIGVSGGYASGGGYGSLTSLYGMAADSVLEWELVTATGEHLTATPRQHADLYWALSGGGTGAFAVIVSMTTRTYNDGPMQGATFTITNSNATAFWNTIDLFHTIIAPVVDTGATITYFIRSNELIVFAAVIPGSEDQVQITSILDPVITKLFHTGGAINVTTSIFPSYHALYESYFASTSSSAAVGQITGGRIIPRDSLTPTSPNVQEISSALRAFTDAAFYIACAALNADSRQPPVIPNAVLPLWRSALLTCIMVQPWDYSLPWAENLQRQEDLANIYMPQLVAATPGGGGYLNEAHFDTPNWQEEFYGANYPRLEEIKWRYDPEGIFYARTAVGSEKWAEDEEGRLCRVA